MLMPIGAEVNLVYVCPDCKGKHYVSSSSVSHPSGFTIGCCGKVYTLQPLKSRVKCVKVKQESFDSIEAVRLVANSLDCSRKNAKQLVQQAMKHNPQSTKDLIRYAIAEI